MKKVLNYYISVGDYKHPITLLVTVRRISGRAAADKQMRTRFEALADQLTIPTLYGVSALGTRLCVYTYDIGDEISPAKAYTRRSKESRQQSP
jgi:hypothetical protein